MSKITTIEEPDTRELAVEVQNATALAIKIKVTNEKQYTVAVGYLQEVKERTKKVKAFFEETKTLAQKLHKAIVAQEKLLLDPLAEAEATIKRVMAAYQLELEQARRAAQKLIDEANEKARLAALKAAETGLKRDETRANKLEAKADETQETLAVPLVKVSGASSRIVFKFEITNFDALPREYLMPNDALIRRTVNALGLEAMKVVPGIIVTEDVCISGRL